MTIDPLRMRIFSELNIQLGPHGIEKDVMHATSKHLAFLVRYYTDNAHPDPLSISIPIIDIPLLNPSNEVVMSHKISLVVHIPGSTALAPPASTTPTSTNTSTSASPASCPASTGAKKAGAKTTTTAAKKEYAPRMHVLIENRGTLGHRKCLIGGFAAVAEPVIGGLLAGEKILMDAMEGKFEKNAKGVVWDVMPWGDAYC